MWFEAVIDDPDLAKVISRIVRKYDDLEEWDQAALLGRLEQALLPD